MIYQNFKNITVKESANSLLSLVYIYE